MKPLEKKLLEHLVFLYGEDQAPALTKRFLGLLYKFQEQHAELSESMPSAKVSERDAILITYGDMVQESDETPLITLASFLKKYLDDVISTVHILPFYPYSSDDGFSVIDYRRVNSDFGTWEDVANLSENFRLMFDAVVNHTSSQGAAFQGYLRGVQRLVGQETASAVRYVQQRWLWRCAAGWYQVGGGSGRFQPRGFSAIR